MIALVVFSYFAAIIKDVNGKSAEVELLTDGGWRVPSADTSKKAPIIADLNNASSVSIKSDVAAASSTTKFDSTSLPSTAPSTAASKPPNSEPEIITLDDSDDDDDVGYNARATTATATTATAAVFAPNYAANTQQAPGIAALNAAIASVVQQPSATNGVAASSSTSSSTSNSTASRKRPLEPPTFAVITLDSDDDDDTTQEPIGRLLQGPLANSRPAVSTT